MISNRKCYGLRCRFSEEGKKSIKRCGNNHDRSGTIIRASNGGGSYVVVWDGSKTGSSIHKSFVEIFTEESSIPEQIDEMGNDPL